MAEDDDDPVSLPPALAQARSYQRRADAPPLVPRKDGHRRKGQGGDHAGPRYDRQVAEMDVADDLAPDFGHQRHPDIAAVPKGIDEPGLFVLTEGGPVDVPDGVLVGGGFWPNDDAHGWLFRAMSPYSPANTSPFATVVALPLSSGREYDNPLLVLTGGEYAKMSPDELLHRLEEAIHTGPRVVSEFWDSEGQSHVVKEDDIIVRAAHESLEEIIQRM